MKKYRFYEDPGHGWLAVKKAECAKLGILNSITSCSYVKGNTIYLEEDYDAGLFMEAKKKLNEGVELVRVYTDSNAKCKSYDRFVEGQIL